MLSYENFSLSVEQAKTISSSSERNFALRCLAVGCLLYYQVPIGHSCIDFLVINPKAHQHADLLEESYGILVEVTLLSRADKEKKTRQKVIKGKKKKLVNKTGLRKERQIQAMAISGYRWTILYEENMEKIMKGKAN